MTGRAANKNKTHCKRGHPFTPENTRTNKGYRECRECRKLHARTWYDKKALARELGVR